MNTARLFFDKNEERIAELSRLLASGKGDPVSIQARIDRYRERGPEWWAVYRDDRGIRRREKPPENTAEAAELLAKSRQVEVSRNEYNPPDKLDVRLSTILAFFREYKNNSRDTRQIHGKIEEKIGNKTLKVMVKDRTLLVDHFRRFPYPDWSDKTVWNYYVKLKAALGLWIKFHQLAVANPADIVPMVTGLAPNTQVREETPTVDHYNALMVACIEAEAPDELMDLFSVVRFSGLRVSEVLSWRIEDLHLEPKRDEDGNVTEVPYFSTIILKQRRQRRIQVPMSVDLWRVLKRLAGDRLAGPLWRWRTTPYKLIRELGIMERAGMKDFRPFHDWRKSFKTELKAAGYSSEYTKYLQGHATDSMDNYYTQFKRHHVQGAYLDGYNRKEGK